MGKIVVSFLLVGWFYVGNSSCAATADQLWQFTADSAIVKIVPQSTLADGQGSPSFFAVCASGALYRLEAGGPSAGKALWQTEAKGEVRGVVQTGGQKNALLTIVTDAGHLEVISATTGKQFWARQLPSAGLTAVGEGPSDDVSVFIGCRNGGVYGLSAVGRAKTKDIRWIVDTVFIDSSSAFAGGNDIAGVRAAVQITDRTDDHDRALALALGRREIRCISPRSLLPSSRVRWIYFSSHDVRALTQVPDVDGDGVTDCAVVCGGDSVILLSGKSGTALDRFAADDSVTCFAAASIDDAGATVFAVGDKQGKVYGLIMDKALAGWRVAWVFDLRSDAAVTSAAVYPDARAGGALGFVIGGQNNKVYVISLQGKKMWSDAATGTVLSIAASAGLSRDEGAYIVIGDDGGTVTCFRPTLQKPAEKY